MSDGVTQTNAQYPFLAYGTDWLAFAHLVIAIAFVGPYIDPVRNKWVVIFGLIACAGVIPLALIAGPIRRIPLGWPLIDCSFGATHYRNGTEDGRFSGSGSSLIPLGFQEMRFAVVH